MAAFSAISSTLAAVWLYAVVDAVVIAMKTPRAYQLKDYKHIKHMELKGLWMILQVLPEK